MNKINLKKILHALVESIKEKRTLYNLEKDVFPYVIKNRTKKKDNEELDLTEEQKLRLEKSITEVDARNTITMEEFEEQLEKHHPGFKKKMAKRREKKEKKIRKSSKKKLRKKLHSLIDEIKSKYVLNVFLNDIMPDSL